MASVDAFRFAIPAFACASIATFAFASIATFAFALIAAFAFASIAAGTFASIAALPPLAMAPSTTATTAITLCSMTSTKLGR
jgi:hypothetical protein